MSPSDLLAILSGGVVGFALGLVGGGGSILAVPLLIYVVGVSDPHVAIGTSALAVSANAFANLVQHARAGTVKWPCAATFAAAGVVGALGGSTLGKLVDGERLLILFALAMVAVGVSMLRGRSGEGNPDVRLNPRMAPRLIAGGLLVGFLSGFFGIGGVAGGWGGMRLAISLAAQRGLLSRVFAAVLFAVAAYMLYRSVGPLIA